MNEPKAYASLSSGLLARKGGAKPAMRPQGFTHFGGNIEDLGWNDMGGEVESYDHVPSSIAALTPAPNGRTPVEPGAASEPAPEPVEELTLEPPVVVEQQRALEESFAPAELKAEPVAEEPVEAEAPAPLPAAKPRLRLACAVTGKSAQQLVTGALDEFLSSLPEVEELAGRVPAGQRSR